MTKRRLRSLLILSIAFIGISTFVITKTITNIRAEQSGGSPESGADSRLKQLADSLETLGYGDPANGALGDWGESWNRISSAAQDPFSDAKVNGIRNGGNADFPQNVGGINDLNPLPSGTYASTWTTCNVANNYCGTGDPLAEKRDENTGLIWSTRLGSIMNWFIANNCTYPNGALGDDGACNTHNEVACQCIKRTESKTGCEAQGDGNWRLPSQKDLMMAYIDGSSAHLSDSLTAHWSSTTVTATTQNTWDTVPSNGFTRQFTKTNGNSVRCVR